MQQPSLQVQAPAFRRVNAGRGGDWWSTAWKLMFERGAAGVWIVMTLIVIIICGPLHLVPLLGSIAAQIIWFVFAGGLMLAARKTEQGTSPAVGDLFSGFGPSLGPLALVAVLVMVGVLLVFGVLAMAGISAVVGAVTGFATGNLAALASLGAASLLLLLVGLLLLLPIGMAAWLAPALVVFRQQAPFEALKTSLAACWANLSALTLYGLLWIGFAVIASIPLGLGWLVLAPLMVLSTYAAYRDLFEPPQ
jgi:uncharacterized membrane protein